MDKTRAVTRLRKPTFQNLLILMSSEFAARGFTFVAFAYLARTLGQANYGFIAPAYAILMFCTLVADFGAGTFGTREVAKNPETADDLTNKIVSAQMLLAIVMLCLLVFFCFIIPANSIQVRLLIGFGISLLGTPFVLNWVFQGRNEMFLAAAPMALRQAVFLIIVLFVVSQPADVVRLPLAEIGAVAAAGLIFVIIYNRRVGRLRLSFAQAVDKDLFKEALPIGGAQFIWALRIYLPVVAVGIIKGSESAGLFDVGHRIVMVFLTLLGVYFTNLLPALSLTSHDSMNEMKQLLYRSLFFSVICAVGLAVFIYFSAPLVLKIVYGNSFVEYESVKSFVVLTLLVPVLALRRNGRTALITLNLQNLDFHISAAGAVLMILLLLPLTYFYGIIGCAWSMVISELVSAVLTWIFLLPKIRIRQAAMK
ncbi:MAG: oligosaccharide flippase family protein [Acidobacteriota bacterium]